MQVITNFEGNYIFDPIIQYNWNKFENTNTNIVLCYGNGIFNKHIKNDKKINVLLDFESPNAFFVRYLDGTIKNCIENFDFILTICPFYVDYLNKIKPGIGILIPFFLENINTTPLYEKKDIEIIYTGHFIHSLYPLNIIHRFISENYPNSLKYMNPSNYYEKIKILLKTKISVMHCNLTNEIPNQYEVNDENVKESFNYIYEHSDSIPQLKSRVFEAAMCKCIILCYKDKYQVISKYFKENEDFLFFESYDNLKKITSDILSNYEKYKILSENAYAKFINNYTTDKVYENIISKLR